MADLKNHPGLWMNAAAAASLERFEADHGVQPITSAGRTEGEQQLLIDRWDRGGKYNRPPYLYAPKRPAHKGEHVAGNAVDVANHREFARLAAPHGWWQPYSWDVVHFEYDPARDQHRNRSGSNVAPITPEEEDNMQSIKVAGGKEYGIGQEFLSHYSKGAEASITRRVMSAEDELHEISQDEFLELLDGCGIPREVIDSNGYVLVPGTGIYKNGGVWSRNREILAALKVR